MPALVKVLGVASRAPEVNGRYKGGKGFPETKNSILMQIGRDTKGSEIGKDLNKVEGESRGNAKHLLEQFVTYIADLCNVLNPLSVQ